MVAGCDTATMLIAVTEERPYMHQNGGISPFFLSLGTRCREVVSFKLQLLYHGKTALVTIQLEIRLVQSWSGHGGNQW